ncbi:hypothetical protein [Hymenobacter rubidus]|uniref:hypothetical protein n=1 Tax=Hymenobacter rubidus TaxID=1441626 RepID=UPI00191FD424|nr:hypothetical protein [Hymenobacter rubidus]
MIRFQTPAGEVLSLPGGDISFEIANPYFQTDAIPGITTYPFDLAADGANSRLLGWPRLQRGAGGPAPVVVDCYLYGQRWKRGSLVYRGFDAQKNVYRTNFVADASDLAKQLAAVKLPDLVVPDLVFAPTGPGQAGYVLAPVRNTEFFDDKNPAFKGILNAPGLGAAGPNQVYVPMLYLVPALRAILATFGYTITGSWVDDPEIQSLVIYSDRALPASQAVGSPFNPARHLPAITVAEALLGLQNQFCLGLYFQTSTQQVRITALREVVQRGPYTARPGAVLTSAGPNATTGFTLKQDPDTNDELDKTLDIGWQQLVIGAGGEPITAAAGTLHLVREENPNAAGRQWLVPAISAKGASAEYELGDDSRTGLRLLFDRGLQNDSQGQPYRLLSPGTTNYAGASVGAYSLRWDGPQGLYATWHKPWLDFRSRAVPSEYEVPFRIADLLTLDPAGHELVEQHLLLWEKVQVKVSAGSRLQSATISYRELL